MQLDPLSKRLLIGAGQNGLISLMYHSITPGDSTPSWEWALSFKRFCDQLSLLQTFGWHTVSLAQLKDGVKSLPKKSILITFDDGYADNFAAFNELTRRNMQACWFIVTKDVGTDSSWHDLDAPSAKLLTEPQLIEMSQAGMDIGAHTHSHCRLTTISADLITRELTQSKEYLSTLLNKPVYSLAYPYGLYNQEVLTKAKESGYKLALTTRSGFGLVDNNPLEIRRVSVMAGDNLSTFARKLAFADNEVNWAKMGSYALTRLKSRLSL